MHNYKELLLWQKSIDLTVDVYKLTEKFPSEERYVLAKESRRTAISIPSNIAEGAGRNTNKQFSQFLEYSLGSTNELETQLIIAEKLNFITSSEYDNIFEKIDHIQKMNRKLQSSFH